MKKWKLRIIHMTHTDIGYKDVQEKVLAQQMSYFDDIIKQFDKNDKNIVDNWKWTIESFGVFEMYYESTTTINREKIINLIKKNKVGLTGNFYNFAELLSRELFGELAKRVYAFSQKYSIKIQSAITNDVNGFSQSYAEELHKNNIESIYFGLHPHHGIHPTNKKQWPFWWELPNGSKVLTWIGEQYAFGNNLGFVKGPLSDYIVKDGLTAGWDETEQIKLSTDRIIQHIKKLEKDGYPFDVIPITVLGTGADNDPPNFEIIDRIKLFKKIWQKHGIVEINMCTLDDFFKEIRNQVTDDNIPTYKGEMPDWWTNGSGSSPINTRIYRQAQRNYRTINKLCKLRKKDIDKTQLENNLALFAEHTFGGELSITEVHGMYHFEIEQLKGLYPRNALKESIKQLDELTNYKNYKLFDLNTYHLKITNIFDVSGKTTVDVTRKFGLNEFSRITQSELVITNTVGEHLSYELVFHEHPTNPLWGHHELYINVSFNYGYEEQFITIQLNPKDSYKKAESCIKFNNNVIESKFFNIKLNNNGIEQITYNHKNLLKTVNSNEQIFSPMYEVENCDYKDKKMLFTQRQRTSLNQRGKNSKQHSGTLESFDCKISSTGQSAKLKLYFKVESTSFYEVSVSINNNNPYLTTEINMIKNPEWSMENFFINFPLLGKLLIDKDNLYEPLVDQIPGSLIDFHSFQDGFIAGDTFVTSKDQNLLWIGPAKFEERQFAKKSYWKAGDFTFRAWPLNNNWETNFSPDTSGFHQFRFKIEVSKEKKKKEKLSFMSIDPIVERVDDKDKII